MLTPKIKTVFRVALVQPSRDSFSYLMKAKNAMYKFSYIKWVSILKIIVKKEIKPGKIYPKPSDTRYVKMIYIPQRCDTAQSPLRANSEYKVGSHCLANELT